MPLDPKAVAFFYEHAPYSHTPDEAPEAGRMRAALDYARAECEAEHRGWHVEWSDDWEVGSHRDHYGPESAYADGEPDTCELAVLEDKRGHVIGSLGCVDDASGDYRRVVAAELASEALSERRARKAKRREARKALLIAPGTRVWVTGWAGHPFHVVTSTPDTVTVAGHDGVRGTVRRADVFTLPAVPDDYPVRPLVTPAEIASAKDAATCGTCGRTWDDGIATSITPVPSARCPFEYYHAEADA